MLLQGRVKTFLFILGLMGAVIRILTLSAVFSRAKRFWTLRSILGRNQMLINVSFISISPLSESFIFFFHVKI